MGKGEWSLTTIAAFILVLIVLVLLIVAFREKFAGLMTSFGEILKGASGAGGEEIVKNAVNAPTTT